MTGPELNHEKIIELDCVLSQEERTFLRSAEVQNDVTDAISVLKEDILCVNLAQTEKLQKFLHIKNESIDSIISTYTPMLGSNRDALTQRYSAIEEDGEINVNYKELMKSLLLIRCVIKYSKDSNFMLPTVPTKEERQQQQKNAYDYFQETNFRHDLYEFQKDTNSLSDCIIGPKTRHALLPLLPTSIQQNVNTAREDPGEKRNTKRYAQEFHVENIQAYVIQRSKELEAMRNNGEAVNESADFCSGFVNGVLTDIAFKQGRTYEFPQPENDAREKDKDLRSEFFSSISLSTSSSKDELVATLTTAQAGSVITVQNSISVRTDKGVTHTLISLGGGRYKELVGSKVRVITISKSTIVFDQSSGSWAIDVGNGVLYRFVASVEGKPGATLYTPDFEKFPKVEFVTISLEKRKKNHGNNAVEIAKSLALSYGGSMFYRLGVLGTKVLDDKTIQIPVKKTSGLVDPVENEEEVVLAEHQREISEELFAARKRMEEYGYSVSDIAFNFLSMIYINETKGGWKRTTSEARVISDNFSHRVKLMPFVDRAKSIGPFQINIDVFRNLLKKNPQFESDIHEILDKEGFNKDRGKMRQIAGRSLTNMGYQKTVSVLNNPVVGMYVASKLQEQSFRIVMNRCSECGTSVNESDAYLTAQMMHNTGPQVVYGAILQQELYKVCKKLGCAVPQEFAFDGRYGTQSEQLLNCVNQVLLKDTMQFTKNNKGVITGFTSGRTNISATDTLSLVYFFRDALKTPDNELYYPALDYEFLKGVSLESGNKVRAHYVQSTVKNTEKRNAANKFTGVNYDLLQDTALAKVVNNRDINYRTAGEQVYDAKTGTGHFDCLDFVKYHLSDKEAGWKEGSCRMKNVYSFHDMFTRLRISGYMTPQKYGNFNEFKNMVYNVRVGDVVGIGHIYDGQGSQHIKRINQNMSMSHGGIVSKVERNEKGEVVQVWMMHSSGTEELGGKGPTEVPLFGPGGYYETVCDPYNSNSKKRVLVFGYEGGRTAREMKSRGGKQKPQV